MQLSKVSIYLITTVFSTISYANTLHFTINDIRSDKGKVYVQLFQGSENYNANKAAQNKQVSATHDEISVTFSTLAKGEYAIRYFHDENGNGKLDTNMFGIPTEGVGFSNNAKPHYGPAKYNDMQFTITESETVNQSNIYY